MFASGKAAHFYPVAAFAWVIVATILWAISTVEFALHDVQAWPALNVSLVENVETPENTLLVNVNGGFFYDGERERLSDAYTDELLTRLESQTLIEEATVIEASRVSVILSEGVDADVFAQTVEAGETPSVQRVNAIVVTLEADASTDSLIADAQSVPLVEQIVIRPEALTEVDAAQVILLLSERANEANVENLIQRFGNVKGVASVSASTVSRITVIIPAEVDFDALEVSYQVRSGVESVTAEPLSRLQLRVRETAVTNTVLNRVGQVLNDLYPLTNLNIHLWLPKVSLVEETLLRIRATDTELPLYGFALGFALLELVLAFILRNSQDKLIRPLIRAAGVFLLFWSIFGHEPFWDFVLAELFPNSSQYVSVSSGSRVVSFVGQHLELVIVSSLITIPLGLLMGIFVTRQGFREFLPLVNNLVNFGQAVPTLAILAMVVPILSLQPGFKPVIIALVMYGLLPVVRNTVVGLESVDVATIDAARGMGMTPTQILFRIELPIASRVILAGVRTSMVVNVGTATLGAFIGAGGLGFPIQSGISMNIYPFVFLGAFPAALLAILIDYVLGRVEYVITPRGLQIAQ